MTIFRKMKTIYYQAKEAIFIIVFNTWNSWGPQRNFHINWTIHFSSFEKNIVIKLILSNLQPESFASCFWIRFSNRGIISILPIWGSVINWSIYRIIYQSNSSNMCTSSFYLSNVAGKAVWYLNLYWYKKLEKIVSLSFKLLLLYLFSIPKSIWFGLIKNLELEKLIWWLSKLKFYSTCKALSVN